RAERRDRFGGAPRAKVREAEVRITVRPTGREPSGSLEEDDGRIELIVPQVGDAELVRERRVEGIEPARRTQGGDGLVETTHLQQRRPEGIVRPRFRGPPVTTCWS